MLIEENLKDFINERFKQVKRKKDPNPRLIASDQNSPTRTRIFNFIEDKGEVPEEDLREFLKKVSIDRGLKNDISLSRFVERNSSFIERLTKGGVRYRLTTYGKRVLKILNKIDSVDESKDNSLNEQKDQDFSGQDLSGQDFSGQDLKGANFENAILNDVNFKNADLQFAIFSGVKGLDQAKNLDKAQNIPQEIEDKIK